MTAKGDDNSTERYNQCFQDLTDLLSNGRPDDKYMERLEIVIAKEILRVANDRYAWL